MAAWFGRWGLDPRRRLSAAIGWAVVTVVTLAALLAAGLAARQAERRARADADALLAEWATQVRDAVSMQIEARRLMLQVVAGQFGRDGAPTAAALDRALAEVQARFPEFGGLAVATAAGGWASHVGTPPPLDDARDAPWFDRALQAPLVTDRLRPASDPAVAVAVARPGTAAAPATAGADADPTAAGRLYFAAPWPAAAGRAGGVLVGQVPLGWVREQLDRMGDALGGTRRLELMLANRDGRVIAGPTAWLGRVVGQDSDLTEDGRYVLGRRTELRLADSLGLGWTAVVRQPAELTLEPVRRTRQAVFLTVFGTGLLAALVAVLATRALTRRLHALALQAEQVRGGRQDTLAPPPGADEVARIGRTLAEVVSRLQAEKRALQALNAELDARVAERTRRIEQMATASRQAAVSRERLRIARDLHDTLAHSMVALLTQVRLVRKLRARLSADELDAELGRAEQVAAEGLADARAAIAQIRDHGVREAGLAGALADLARRFGERSGVAVDLRLDPQAAGWSEARHEAVFRVVEEALRNVERHAGARRVAIRASAGPGEGGRVEVADDGVGFDPAAVAPGHFGLQGMHEQAELAGARLQLDSRPGAGTRVRLDWAA